MVAVSEGGTSIASCLVLVDITPRIERAGAQRIGNFMNSGGDGFASLEEAADAISAYMPDRPRPDDLSGLRKNLRQREDGRWIWHWDPRAFGRGRAEAQAAAAGQSAPSNPQRGPGAPNQNRMAEAAAKVKLPTLLVRGRMSDVVSEEGVREFRELIPHAEVVDVAGAGHMVAGDRNDAFNDAVIEFIERVDPT